ncbi:MAG: aldose 1-epimerase [Bryobacteraceae bacterium]
MAETCSAQRVTVDSIETIRLSDPAHAIDVSICPPIGNIAYDMRVRGNPILMSPPKLSEWKQKPSQAGIPLLAPWANRLDADAYWANGKRYLLNPDAVEIRRDPNGLPIHGLLLYASAWHIERLHADEHAAEVSSVLEFWRHPEWMAQFPFAHTIRITHRLYGGVLEVRTTIENHSTDSMPLVVGFHPWYQIPETPRDRWQIHLPVREHFTLSAKLIPTGESNPVDFPDPTPLVGRQFDDVFGGVDHAGEFVLEADGRKISVRFGPKFPIAIVYAPPAPDVVCFEPMTGLTDGFNLAHAGVFKNLQSIAAGATWTESFWIRPTGF